MTRATGPDEERRRTTGSDPEIAWERELRLLDLASVPLRAWRTIATVTAVAILLGLLFILVVPRPYRSETLLLPMSEDAGADISLLALISDMPFVPGPLSELEGESDVIGAILESRSLADSVIHRMDLMSVWDEEEIEDAREELDSRTTVERDEDSGTILVAIEDQDPDRAARVANTFAEVMNEVSGRLASDEARRRQKFLEAQLVLAGEDVEIAETRLVEFLRSNEIPAVEEQARATIEAAARIEREIMVKELELAQLRRFSTPENPALRRALSELAALRAQLREITEGRDPAGADRGDALLTFPEVPELGVTYATLLREYEKNQQIYTSLAAGLAEARLQIVADMPVVNVLDPAVPPKDRAGMGPWLVLLLTGLTGLLIGTVAAAFRDWLGRARRDESNRLFFESWDRFRSDMRGIRFWRR